MSAIVTRDTISMVLDEWQSSRWTSEDVHDWAESRYAVDTWECEDDVTNEVLAALDVLDMNLLTRDDVPVLQAMLRLLPGQATCAAKLLNAHMQTINLANRRTILAHEAPYAPFCGA